MTNRLFIVFLVTFLGFSLLFSQPHPFKCTKYAGLEISVNSRIAWQFSRQIANSNAGPSSALDSMGVKPSSRCHSLNIASMYKQKARKSFLSAQILPSWPLLSAKK